MNINTERFYFERRIYAMLPFSAGSSPIPKTQLTRISLEASDECPEKYKAHLEKMTAQVNGNAEGHDLEDYLVVKKVKRLERKNRLIRGAIAVILYDKETGKKFTGYSFCSILDRFNEIEGSQRAWNRVKQAIAERLGPILSSQYIAIVGLSPHSLEEVVKVQLWKADKKIASMAEQVEKFKHNIHVLEKVINNDTIKRSTREKDKRKIKKLKRKVAVLKNNIELLKNLTI